MLRTFVAILITLQLFLTGAFAAGPGAKKDSDGRAKASVKAGAAQRKLWGRKESESEADYAKRRARMIKRCRKDTLGLYAIRNLLFLVRTDVSPEFTVDLALYMEELHRAYSGAFTRMGAPPSKGRDIIEVVCYKDRERYIKEGGDPNSGGHFHPAANFNEKYWNRPKGWPAGQFRLQLFTSGVEDFDQWEKKTLKHEAAHMELQLRLGYSALDAPRWWNEGMAACFEEWDFDKSINENFAEIPRRGSYAPFIRKIWGTDLWKDFNYVWTIDGKSWHQDMGSFQGMLNYCQAWSLAAFMFNQSTKGKKFFNQIFNLSITLGEDTANPRGVKKRGWEEAFSLADRAAMEQAWLEWIKTALPKDQLNPGEEMFLLRRGFDPRAESLVSLSPEEIQRRFARLNRTSKNKPRPPDDRQAGDEPASATKRR